VHYILNEFITLEDRLTVKAEKGKHLFG